MYSKNYLENVCQLVLVSEHFGQPQGPSGGGGARRISTRNSSHYRVDMRLVHMFHKFEVIRLLDSKEALLDLQL